MTVWSNEKVLEQVERHAKDGIGLSAAGTIGLVAEVRRLQDERQQIVDTNNFALSSLKSAILTLYDAAVVLDRVGETKLATDTKRVASDSLNVFNQCSGVVVQT